MSVQYLYPRELTMGYGRLKKIKILPEMSRTNSSQVQGSRNWYGVKRLNYEEERSAASQKAGKHI